MKVGQNSYVEALASFLKCKLVEYRIPFFSALCIGFLSHMFVFTNKLLNHDEICNLFDKGATVSSGRWGIEILRIIFPDYSMPWIYGVISLVLLAVAACIIVKLFVIKNRLLQSILSGLIVSFPSLTGLFSYMFTSAPYALAFLLAVLAADLYEKGGWKHIAGAAGCAFFSLSIYQAYIAVTASFFIIVLIQKLLTGVCDARQVFCQALRRIVFLVSVLAAYYASVQIVLFMTGNQMNQYAQSYVNADAVSPLRRIYITYASFVSFFIRGIWGIASTLVSKGCHLLAIGGVLILLINHSRKLAWKSVLLLWGMLALLPAAINCMYLILNENAIHTLVLYSIVAIYVLFAVLIEYGMNNKRLLKDIVLAAIIVILINNVYTANKAYLQLHLAYENAYSFYTQLIAQVKQTPGFDENTKLAIIGEAETANNMDAFGNDRIQGIMPDLVNVYSRELFIEYYVGFSVPFATEAEKQQLVESSEFMQMQPYPYYGSVKKIGSYIVVKLENYNLRIKE